MSVGPLERSFGRVPFFLNFLSHRPSDRSFLVCWTVGKVHCGCAIFLEFFITLPMRLSDGSISPFSSVGPSERSDNRTDSLSSLMMTNRTNPQSSRFVTVEPSIPKTDSQNRYSNSENSENSENRSKQRKQICSKKRDSLLKIGVGPASEKCYWVKPEN
jgi:hypothetical protein